MKKKKEELVNWNFNPITGMPNEQTYHPCSYYHPSSANTTDDEEIEEEEDMEEDMEDDRKPSEIDPEKLRAITERVRWRNARKVRGYKFQGAIPKPKEISDYMPWILEK